MKKIFLLLLVFGAVYRVTAQNGLDLSFGQQGIARFSQAYNDEGARITILPGGQVLLLSTATTAATDADIVLTQTDTNGTLVSNFGNGGVLRFDFDTLPFSRAVACAVNPDGSFVVLGGGTDSSLTRTYFCLEKFSSTGQRDLSFAGTGLAAFTFLSTSDVPHALHRDASGRLLISGMALSNGNFLQEFPALARFTANGFPDTSFAGTGKLVFDFLNGANSVLRNGDPQVTPQHLNGGYFMDAQELPDGTILGAGAYNNGFNYEGAFVRFTTAGIPDSSVFVNGYARLNLVPGSNQSVDAFDQTAAGFVAVMNAEAVSGNQDYYLLSGDFSSTFIDANAWDVSSTCDRATGIRVDDAGNIWICGNAELPAHCSPAYVSDSAFVMHFVPMGQSWTTDANFARQGKSVLAYGAAGQERSAASALAIDSAGAVLIGGTLFTPQDSTDFSDAIIARFQPVANVSGVNALSAPTIFSVFPNPSDGDFFITTENAQPVSATYRLYNAAGALIRCGEIAAPGKCRISWDAPAGFYLLEIFSGEQVQRFKLLHD